MRCGKWVKWCLSRYSVLDGRALLQRIPWSCGSTYGDICHQYTEYVRRKYRNAVFVFEVTNIIWLWKYEYKRCDIWHTSQRRSKGKASLTVTVLANMTITMNRRRSSFWLTKRINNNSFSCWVQNQRSATAKLTMQLQMLIFWFFSTTVLVGNDTDLIVLLFHHASFDSHDIFCPEPRKNKKSFATGISEPPKKNLDKIFVITFSSSTLFLGVTQHHVTRHDSYIWTLSHIYLFCEL